MLVHSQPGSLRDPTSRSGSDPAFSAPSVNPFRNDSMPALHREHRAASRFALDSAGWMRPYGLRAAESGGNGRQSISSSADNIDVTTSSRPRNGSFKSSGLL